MNCRCMKYNIAGCLIDSYIPDMYLRSNFSDYIVSCEANANVVVKLMDGCLSLPDEAERVDKYKYYKREKNSYTYYYVSNKYVNGCIVEKNYGTGLFGITVLFDEKDENEMSTIKKEITYAFMDAFYLCLVFFKKMCLHSCGFVAGQKGILVTGEPGSGKTTLVNSLSEKISVEIIGEDINACSMDLDFYGMPWCRVNHNCKHEIDAIIFLGNKTKLMNENDIFQLLLKSEFSISWFVESKNNIKEFARLIYQKKKCYMIENNKDICTVNRFVEFVKEIMYE